MPTSDFTTPQEARMRVDLARAAILQLELERRSGALVPLQEAQDEIFRLVRGDRDALLAWPSRAAPHVAIALGCTEQAAYSILDELIREFIIGLSKIDVNIAHDATEGGITPEGEVEIRAGLSAIGKRIKIGG